MFEHHCKVELLARIIRKQKSRDNFSQPDLVVILQSQPHTNRHAPRQDYGLTRVKLTIYQYDFDINHYVYLTQVKSIGASKRMA